MEKGKWSLAGAFLAAVAASACCWGPLTLAALGLGSLGAFAALEKYRPLFMAATLALLGAAFYLTYRRREETCEDGGCRVSSAGPKAKAVLWAAAIAAVGVMSSPRWMPALMKGGADPVPAKGQSLETVVLKVSGMDCAMCIPPIEKELRKVPGVSFARVDFDKQTAVVRGTKLDVKKLLAAVKAVGYRATPIKGTGEKP
jgi:copper chaperone CopZ